METHEEVFKISCHTTENEQTGRIIEVALWNEIDESGFKIITITTDKGVITLTIKDLPDLILSLQQVKEKE